MRKLKIIITGSTGMVGEGVLNQCLLNDFVEKVLVINRKSCGVSHPKLKEVLHSNFYDLSAVENELAGYDTCFFCLGISSVGMSEEDYFKTTYTLTMHFGQTLSRLNPNMVFTYISGAGTDSSEKGRSNWARVKGKTENDLMKLPFKAVYNFRPGFIKPIAGMKNTKSYYKYVLWLYPIGRALFSKGFCTLQELAAAKMEVALNGFDKHIVEGNDIIALSELWQKKSS
jgi:uncharacterized protein YbjT (DUF2867 family)